MANENTEADLHPSPVELQRQACRLRCQADELYMQAWLRDQDAKHLEERLGRLGLESFYCGSLERGRLGRALLAESDLGMQTK